MSGRRKTYTKPIGLALAVVLGGSTGAAFVGVLQPSPEASERADQAWSQRLAAHADEIGRARSADAYAMRLLGIHQERLMDVWTDRLDAQADALGARGMDERAQRAWTDRLDGLAEAHAAK